MKKEKITKTEELFVDVCPICKKRITGYSEPQVNSRMEMHKRKHKESNNIEGSKPIAYDK